MTSRSTISMAATRLWLVSALLPSDVFAADKAFTGEDAAPVDCAWKNCGVTATPKQRELADRASAASGKDFQRSYEQQYQKLIDTMKDAPATKRQCETVVAWYSPARSRIAALIASKNERPAAPGVSVGSPASGNASGGESGKRGGGHRGGSQ